jgi:hypothetical protein
VDYVCANAESVSTVGHQRRKEVQGRTWWSSVLGINFFFLKRCPGLGANPDYFDFVYFPLSHSGSPVPRAAGFDLLTYFLTNFFFASGYETKRVLTTHFWQLIVLDQWQNSIQKHSANSSGHNSRILWQSKANKSKQLSQMM